MALTAYQLQFKRRGQSTPGEEEQLFNLIPDGNGGQPLPENPLFGEFAAGTPIIPPAQASFGVAPEKTPEQMAG